MVHPVVSVISVVSPVVCSLLGGSGRCCNTTRDVAPPRAVLLRAWPARHVP
jgi:hypothetical protein